MGLFDFVGSLFSNAASAKQASAQRAFQEEMSDTAHQREVKDLTAAGLNPLLSVNSGASTPSGAMGSITAPNIGNPIQEGLQTVGAAKQLAQTDATTDSIKAQAEASRANAVLARANAAKATADIPDRQLKGGVSQAIINSAKGVNDIVQGHTTFNPMHPIDNIRGWVDRITPFR